jgi:uncharacterized membrane protein
MVLQNKKGGDVMYSSAFFCSSWWWVWPVLMVAMCFFMMRRWKGPMMCGFGHQRRHRPQFNSSDSASDILDKRYAACDIDQSEYEERKRKLIQVSGEDDIIS